MEVKIRGQMTMRRNPLHHPRGPGFSRVGGRIEANHIS